MPRLRTERYEKIINDYLSGMTQKETAEANNIGRDAVWNILHRFDISTREYTGSRSNSARKWYWDFDFFKERTPIVAYWAGFVMADGCISKAGISKSFILDITIKRTDREHVEHFCGDVGLSKESLYDYIGGVGNTPIVTMRLIHPNLKDDLTPWGVIPRKSYNFQEPEVSDELLPHYLRGWADGDGHIYRFGRSARFTVSGNILSLMWYGNSLERLGYKGNWGIQKRNENTGVLYIGGANQTNEILNILMVDTEFCMKRKWNNDRNNA